MNRSTRIRRYSWWTPYLYVLPGLVLYIAFVLLPLGQAGWLSLYKWDGVSQGTWVGLDNYIDLASDPEVLAAFRHAAILVLFISVFPICLGLLLAAVLGKAVVRGSTAFRAALFLPQVVATVVIGLVWSWMLSLDGPVNSLLSALGLGSGTRAWLGDFDTALPAVGLIGAWAATGLCMVLFIAGVQRIPYELYEDARLDGAGAWREFMAITLPGIRSELGVALTLTVIAALRTFDLVYVTTSGGPGQETTVPGLLIYTRAFRVGDVGSAAAIAVVLAAVLLVVSYVITQASERE